MKNYIPIYILCFLSCNSVDDNLIKENLNEQLKVYNNSIKSLDGNELLKFYPPVLYETNEEKESLLQEFNEQKKQMFDNGITVGNIQASEPFKYERNGNEVHAAIEQSTRVHTPDNNISSISYLYALSQD